LPAIPYIAERDFPDFVRSVDLESLFREADVLSLHVPLNDETRGIVNGRTLALMKPGSILRKHIPRRVVDVDARRRPRSAAGRVRSAGLDVPPARADACRTSPS
jgi:D-3-phosphoglycerate dehydrogenase